MQEIINHTNREAAAIKKQRQDKEDAQRKAEEDRRLKQEAQAQQVAKAKEEEEKRLEHAKEQKRQQDAQEEEAREAAKRAAIAKAGVKNQGRLLYCFLRFNEETDNRRN